MIRNYSIGHRYMAYILVTTLFLQSCSNYTKPYIPEEAQYPRPKIEEIDPLQNYNYKDLQILTRPNGDNNLPLAQEPLNIIGIPQESYTIDGKRLRLQNVSGSAMRCFFNAAGLDVQEQIDKLLACQNDPVVRYMIANEIVSAAENPNQLPATVKDAIGFTLYESQKQAVDNLEEKRSQVLYLQNTVGNEQNTQALPKVLQNTSKRYEELREDLRQKACALKAFKAFANDHVGGEQMMVALLDVERKGRGDNPYANYTSIDAIAYINQLGIKIYQPNDLNEGLRLAHQFIPPNATRVIYLYHSNFHFQALLTYKESGSPVAKPHSQQSEKDEEENDHTPHEYILFCGNIGVGKSSLCNSIFNKNVFKSGISLGRGMNQKKQEHVYENRIYIDTPGLSDIDGSKEAAKEVEAALKKNGKYKIVFVLTLEAGKIITKDLETINTICEAIKIPFEYGIIINKVSDLVLEEINKQGGINEVLKNCLPLFLNKQPSLILIMKKDKSMEDEKDALLADSQERKRLLDFISGLKGTHIKSEDVQNTNTTDYRTSYETLKKAIPTGVVVGTGLYFWNSQTMTTTGAVAALAPYLNNINNAWNALKGSLSGLRGLGG